MSFKIQLIIICLITFSRVYSQSYTISGYIEDSLTKERLIGVTIYEKSLGKGAVTNSYGYFSLSLPQKEKLVLHFSYLGYNEQFVSFKEDTFINIKLSSSATQLNEVTINAKNRIEERNEISTNTIQVSQIRNLPVLFGENDILKAIQMLPGVKFGDEGSSGIYVRGGSPDQNLILLDEVPLYYVSHLGGFFSIFNSSAISNIKLVKGGFPARYGGRISSVLDIRMKDGNLKEYHGEASMGLVATKLSFEGPLINDKSSFILSYRRCNLDLLMRPITRIAFDGLVGGYTFYDINSKFNYKFSDKDRLYYSFYNGDDRALANYKDKKSNSEARYSNKTSTKIKWGNTINSLRWNHIYHPKLFGNTSFYYSKYRFLTEMKYSNTDITENLTESYNTNYQSYIEDVGAKIDYDCFISSNNTLRFGANGTYHAFSPGVSSYKTTENESTLLDTAFGNTRINTKEIVGFIESENTITKNLKTNIGIHYSNYFVKNTNFQSLEPRILFTYIFARQFSIKGSYSKMQQYLHLLSNTGAGLPTDLWVPATTKIKPQISDQYSLGFAKTVKQDYEFSVECYYKHLQGLIEFKEGSSFFSSTQDWESKVETGGIGQSYGTEWLLHKKEGKTNGWIGYTLAWVNRKFDNINNGNWYPYKYDRRHDLSLVINHKINDKWSFSGCWFFATGSAITIAVGKYNLIDNTGTYEEDSSLKERNYSEVQMYNGRNSFRMRSYHRLDLGFNNEKKKKWGTRTWNFSIYRDRCKKPPNVPVLFLGVLF